MYKLTQLLCFFFPVVQAGKDVSWVMVIIGGFAITGFLLWSIGSEFFSGSSPSTIFTKALKRVKNDPEVSDLYGNGPLPYSSPGPGTHNIV